MNVLIVDDEIYAVRTLQRNIHWDVLGVNQVFAAYNVEQARQQMMKNQIHLVITDIEMPGETGLDFLRWIHEQDYPCKAICMTCHAEFDYAQTAIRYHAADYIVKPLNLKSFSDTVNRMVQTIKEEELQREWTMKGRMWDQNKERLQNVFWEKLLDGIDSETVSETGKSVLHTGYQKEAFYLLTLFSIRRIEQREEDWLHHREQMKYIVHDVLRENALGGEESGRCGWKDGYFWMILDGEKQIYVQETLENCLEMVRLVTGASMVAYVDRPCRGPELHRLYVSLKNEDQKNVSIYYGIYNINTKKNKVGGVYTEFFLEHLRSLLERHDFAEIKSFVEETRKEESIIDDRRLMTTVEQVKQEIYRLLARENMAVSQFLNDQLLEAGKNIYRSTQDFEDWMLLAIEQLIHMMETAEKSKERDMTSEVKRYIQAHVEERISREDIAAYVAFSPDYVTRLFKKETGMSISEYTMEAKVQRAKQLMDEGNMNIGEIAAMLGYSSFSYFSEVFRRVTGVLPKDYRRTH